MRRETLIERFKIRDLVKETSEMTHETSSAEKNERETKVRCEANLSCIEHVKVTLSRARHVKMCTLVYQIYLKVCKSRGLNDNML